MRHKVIVKDGAWKIFGESGTNKAWLFQ